MPPTPRRPQSTGKSLQSTDNRGITASDVDRAADTLLRAGQRPTIEKVRATIGRGSPNTINPLLDAWWQRLAGRLDAGPAALHRLPEPVLHAAEGLWMTALDDARRRAIAEQGSSRSALTRDRQELEIRSHVLSIRESELKTRLEQAERRAGQLELEVEALTTLLRKEHASRLAAARRETTDSERNPPRKRLGTGQARAKDRSTRQPAASANPRKQTRKTARTTIPRRPTLNPQKRTRR